MKYKKGDRVYFSSVAAMVNEGTVIETEGVFIRVRTKCPGVEWLMEKQVFSTKEDLRASNQYSADYFSMMHRRELPFTQMAGLWY